jgi:hypothetical protein
MKSYYQEILNTCHDDEGIKKAILSNNALIYNNLSKIIMSNSAQYRNVSIKEGNKAADQLLLDVLIIFRRQVKYDKTGIICYKDKLIVTKNKSELVDYLVNLFLLISEISPFNPYHDISALFEADLVKGRGFLKLYELRAGVFSTLHETGCKNQEDKEDIFNESLVIFWKKMLDGETGIYFTGKTDKMDNCHVYNRKFYQNSKLGTFLSGIAKNIYLNRTRTAEFRAVKSDVAELPESQDLDHVMGETENQVEIMFLYYRNFVESRKLRTAISLLQYDCNLEDKEVRQLMGINNARIHSSRQRAHFSEWYEQNLKKVSGIFDASHDYFSGREDKRSRLNEKIRTIDQFERNSTNHVDLNTFREEFRSNPEFNRFHRVFKNAYYLASTGKPSGLTGLPDEKSLRAMMDSYKEAIFSLPNYQAILFLLFYGAEEPDETIISLLKGLHPELAGMEQDSEALQRLISQLNDHLPADPSALTDDVYTSNSNLFTHLSTEKNFINLVN